MSRSYFRDSHELRPSHQPEIVRQICEIRVPWRPPHQRKPRGWRWTSNLIKAKRRRIFITVLLQGRHKKYP